jgi:hypothetical protein
VAGIVKKDTKVENHCSENDTDASDDKTLPEQPTVRRKLPYPTYEEMKHLLPTRSQEERDAILQKVLQDSEARFKACGLDDNYSEDSDSEENSEDEDIKIEADEDNDEEAGEEKEKPKQKTIDDLIREKNYSYEEVRVENMLYAFDKAIFTFDLYVPFNQKNLLLKNLLDQVFKKINFNSLSALLTSICFFFLGIYAVLNEKIFWCFVAQ